MSCKQIKVIVMFDPDEWHGYASEGLWAELEDEKIARLQNTPFFANGLANGDRIEIRGIEDPVVVKLLEDSGHLTYRIVLSEGSDLEDFGRYWEPLQQLGCRYESADFGYNMFAVDVPPNANLTKVEQCLSVGVVEQFWDFDEGKGLRQLTGD